MDNLTGRLNEIARHYGLTKYSEFAKKTGFSHQTASNYLKGKQNPDAMKLSLIIKIFDKVDAHWLLTGDGQMFKNQITEADKTKAQEEIDIQYSEIDINDVVRFIAHNQEDLMKNPIFNAFIEKNAYKKVVEILSAQKSI